MLQVSSPSPFRRCYSSDEFAVYNPAAGSKLSFGSKIFKNPTTRNWHTPPAFNWLRYYDWFITKFAFARARWNNCRWSAWKFHHTSFTEFPRTITRNNNSPPSSPLSFCNSVKSPQIYRHRNYATKMFRYETTESVDQRCARAWNRIYSKYPNFQKAVAD